MPDKTFVPGLNIKRRDNAPDFVICSVGVRCNDLFDFMKQHNKDGWINFDIKLSKNDKYYAELDTWEPDGQSGSQGGGYDDSDAPF